MALQYMFFCTSSMILSGAAGSHSIGLLVLLTCDIYIYTYIYTHVYIYICMYVYTYTCIY